MPFEIRYWPNLAMGCGRGDSNPHALRHTGLGRACLPFHHFRIGVVAHREVYRLRVAVGTEKPQILGSVVMMQSVDMVNLQHEPLAVPMRAEPTLLALLDATQIERLSRTAASRISRVYLSFGIGTLSQRNRPSDRFLIVRRKLT